MVHCVYLIFTYTIIPVFGSFVYPFGEEFHLFVAALLQLPVIKTHVCITYTQLAYQLLLQLNIPVFEYLFAAALLHAVHQLPIFKTR